MIIRISKISDLIIDFLQFNDGDTSTKPTVATAIKSYDQKTAIVFMWYFYSHQLKSYITFVIKELFSS